ncbi:hypothetical protein MATL_G00254300 [Megalops atlanticus]|uniref:Uncharacterized protein n=1 Tax=Megalops atlanticus TaxID=7932 RepID=A0A9D3PE22_MEGAT|nr:hypothetical protein MATL_G00254300 [Megalops atlanticus]
MIVIPWFVASLMVASGAFLPVEPPHTMCKAIWIIGAPCGDVSVALVNQIKMWSSADSCSTGGEKCRYELKSSNQTYIFAKHTTADKEVDDLLFHLKPSHDSPTCRTVGISISEALDRVSDNGANYCNLFNLVEGSGLTKAKIFKEITNDFMCNERSLAKCEVY